jgi:malonyl CoA-acyl carrier protein transacylase
MMDNQNKKNNADKLQEPIAVVGLACLFPGSINIEKYWDNIINKRDLFTEVPKTHWLLQDFYDPNPFNQDKTYCRRAATLPEVPFDYMTFGMPPNVLPQTDSTQLLGLVIAKALMEDAFGGQWKDVDREKTSVIFGFSQGTVLSTEWGSNVITPIFIRAMQECGLGREQIHKIIQQSKKYRHQADENTFPGALGNVIAGRIANRFDFHGTNCVVDAACASSLSALHLGVKELNAGESDLVISGGIQTISSPGTFMCFSRTPALSMKGICRPFDDESDGIMLGEGLGFLALKRLSDAERDKNQIYAVIRGIGSSSDGKGKSIYAPEPTGQARALARTYQNAGYGPETVELIEAHGTGTRAGDIAELTSLHQYFAKKETSDSKYCALGSVKSQIGHTLGAAGAASLIKTILALHHKILPPTINVIKPSRILDSKNSPFYLNLESRPWIHSEDYPRRASVSSFGFGGTNFHVALEEYRGPGRLPLRRDIFQAELLVFSGNSPSDLVQQCQSTISEYESGSSLYVLAKASQAKFNPAAPHRLSLVVNSGEDLKKKLPQIEQGLEKNPEKLWLPPLGIYYHPKFEPKKVAFLFPGQGSQYVNMGADLAMHFDAFRETWDRADRLSFEEGTRLSRVAFPPPTFSDEEKTAHQKRMTATEWAQPCLGVTSAAMLSLLGELGLKAEMVAGHSFGEETALYYAGCYDLETFLKISRKRGELMAHASEIPGGMMAVSGEASKIQNILAELGTDIVIANFNSPDQSVISGRKEALSSIQLRLEQEGMKVTPLQVSTAFHSSLVSGSSENFYHFLKEVDITSPKIPVYSNSNASVYPSDPEDIRKKMAEQLALPVRFLEEINAMYEAGANVFLEVGPGATLSGLIGNILKGKEYLAVNTDIQKKDGVLSLINALAQLTAVGIPVDFKALGRRELAERRLFEKTPTTVMIGSATYKKKYPIADEDPVKQALSRDPIVAGSAKDTHAGVPQKLLDLMQKSKGTDQASIPEAAIIATAVGSDLVPPLENKIPPISTQPYALKQMPSAPKIEKRIPEKNNPLPIPPSNFNRDNSPPLQPAAAPAFAATSSADIEKLKGLLLEVISEKTGYPQEIINPDMNLEADLGIDSIKRVEIFMTLKERVPELPEVGLERLAELQTIAQIVEFMKAEAGNFKGDVTSISKIPESEGPVQEAKSWAAEAPAEPTPAPSVPSAQPLSVSTENLAKLKDLLLQVIAEKTGYPQEILAPEMNLEADLGIDSIKRVEIFMTLKERAPELPEVGLETLAGLQTIGQIIDFMHQGAQDLEKKPASQKEPALVSNSEVPVREQPVPVVKVPIKEQKEENTKLFDALKLQVKENISENLTRFELKVVPLTSQSAVQLAPGKELIIVSEGSGIAEILSRLFEQGGIRNRIIKDEGEIGEVASCAGLIYLGGLRPLQHFYSGVKMNKEAFRFANKLALPIQEAVKQGGAWFITVQDLGGEFGLNQGDLITSLRGGLAGLTKTVAREWLGVYAKAIDIAVSGRSPEELAQDIYQEILKGGEVIEVGIPRSGKRIGLQILEKEVVPGKASLINEKSVIVVSGGARGVTSSCVIELAKQFHPKIVLFGRSPVIEEPHYCQGIADEAGLKKAILEEAKKAGDKLTPMDIADRCRSIMNSREMHHTISELQQAGSPVKYYAVDILESRLIRTEGPSWVWQAGSLVRAVLAEVRQEWGPITGLIHGAGVIQDKLIQEKTQEQFNLVFDTKVSGLNELLNALEKDPLNLIVLFSSISARTANRGQSDYSMANEVLNKIAQAEKRRRGKSCQVKAIGWGPWDGGMLSPFLREQFTKSGVSLISLNGGANAMIREIEDVSGAVEVLIQGSQYQPEIWWKGQLYSKSPLVELPAIQQEKPYEASLLGNYEISKNSQGNLQLTASRVFDPAKDTWLRDHCPTWSFPVLPFTVMTAMMKQAGERLYPNLKLVEMDDVKVSNWVSFLEGPQELHLQAETLSEEGTTKSIKVTLLQYRKAPTAELSRFLPFCTGKVLMSSNFAQTQQGPEFLAEDPKKILSREEIYGEGYRFHGPVFQLLEKIISHPKNKVTAFIQNCRQKYPDQDFAFSLILDNAEQAVPGWESPQWALQNEGTVGFPYLLKKVIFYKAMPEKARLRCEVAFLSSGVDKRLPEWKLRIFDGDGERDDIWMEAEYVHVLVSLGKRSLGFSPWVTRDFAQDRKILPENTYSNLSDITHNTVSLSELKAQDWLPGTLASNFLGKVEMEDYLKLAPDKRYPWLAPRIAAKELVAKMEDIHPAQVMIRENGEGKLIGISEKRPVNPYQFKYDFNGKIFHVQKISDDLTNSDLFKTRFVNTGAEHISLGENLTKALFAKFLKEAVLEDYQEFTNLGGKPCLFLANHQTYIESFLFTIAVTIIGETKTAAVAKREHQEGWIGKLAGLYSHIPELSSMQNTFFVQRERPEEIFAVLSELKQKLLEENKSLLVHVEGTRAKTANEPINKLSTILTDLSIQTGIPIVPVRFRGGLPIQDTGRKYDFPVGYGQQSFYVGKAVWPDDLKKLSFKERTQRVLQAINQLGGLDNEFPTAPDPEFEKKVEAWRQYTGVEEVPAVLYQSLLAFKGSPSVEIKSGVQEFADLSQAFLVAGQLGQKSGKSTALVLPDSPEGQFAAKLGTWVFGSKGPRIYVGIEADGKFEHIVKVVSPRPIAGS